MLSAALSLLATPAPLLPVSDGAGQDESPCGRGCKGDWSVLVLNGGASGWGASGSKEDGQYKAGLSDMSLWLLNAAKVASTVCARIAVPRPCTILTRDHNSGDALNCSLEWSHYVNVSIAYKAGGRAQPLILSGGLNASQSHGLVGVKDYPAAVKAASEGRRFVWHKWDGAAHDWNPGHAECPNVVRFPTAKVLEARRQFFRREQIESYVSLHIRRGAAFVRCDTDVPRVINYVNCSLTNMGHAGFNGTIVILTDETDEAYLTQLQGAFKRRLPNVRVVHADASLRAANPKEDNYFIFAITETLRKRDFEGLDHTSFSAKGWTSPRLKLSLALHWGHCVYCEKPTAASTLAARVNVPLLSPENAHKTHPGLIRLASGLDAPTSETGTAPSCTVQEGDVYDCPAPSEHSQGAW